MDDCHNYIRGQECPPFSLDKSRVGNLATADPKEAITDDRTNQCPACTLGSSCCKAWPMFCWPVRWMSSWL